MVFYTDNQLTTEYTKIKHKLLLSELIYSMSKNPDSKYMLKWQLGFIPPKHLRLCKYEYPFDCDK